MKEQDQLDNLIINTIDEVERGKEDLFQLGAYMRAEHDHCRKQLLELRTRLENHGGSGQPGMGISGSPGSYAGCTPRPGPLQSGLHTGSQ